MNWFVLQAFLVCIIIACVFSIPADDEQEKKGTDRGNPGLGLRFTRKVKRYLVAKCGAIQTREQNMNATREGRLMDADAPPGASAVVNAMPPTPDQLWRIAFCTPDLTISPTHHKPE